MATGDVVFEARNVYVASEESVRVDNQRGTQSTTFSGSSVTVPTPSAPYLTFGHGGTTINTSQSVNSNATAGETFFDANKRYTIKVVED